MKLVLAEPLYLKEPINIISELVTEVKINLNKDCIELVAMDSANVAMIIFKLLSSNFIEYDLKKEEKIAVNLENLKQILRRAKSSDSISLELDKEKNRLRIVIKGENTRTFNLALINIDKDEQKVPKLNFSARVELNSLVFNEAIEDMDIVSDSVNLAIAEKKFVVMADGSLSNAKVEMLKSDETNILGNDVKAKYAIEYLKKMMKAGKLSNNVVVQFDKDYPLKLDYIVKDKMQLSFILAPRVSND